MDIFKRNIELLAKKNPSLENRIKGLHCENARRFAQENLPTWRERLALEVRLIAELISS